MSERTLLNGGHVTSLPSPERIEVIVHLNGRVASVWSTQRAIVESFEQGAGGHCMEFEQVDSGGMRCTHHRIGLSVTVYP